MKNEIVCWFLMGEGVGSTMGGNGVVVVGGGGKFTNVVLYDRLELCNKIQV